MWAGEESFHDSALGWYDDINGLTRWLAAEGPEDWPRVESNDREQWERIEGPTGEVSDIVLEDHRISFSTTAVGVPHLIKVSHFPNWTAIGAEGPWRAAPSLMLVIPTREDVVLEFRNTWVESGGMAMTIVTLAALAALGWRARRRRLAAEARAEA